MTPTEQTTRFQGIGHIFYGMESELFGIFIEILIFFEVLLVFGALLH